MAKVYAVYTIKLSPKAASRLEAEALRRGVKPGRAASDDLERKYAK